MPERSAAETEVPVMAVYEAPARRSRTFKRSGPVAPACGVIGVGRKRLPSFDTAVPTSVPNTSLSSWRDGSSVRFVASSA